MLDIKSARLLSDEEVTQRGALVSRSLGSEFDPAARADLWEKFIATCCAGDGEMESYLQEVAGSCLYGSDRRRQLFVINGSGRNGKSVATNVLARLFGDYAASVSKGALLRRKSDSNNYELANLAGVRLVTCSETSNGDALSDSLVKNVTGGDRVVVRQIYEGAHEITARFTLLLSTNHLPSVYDFSEGMWDRLRLIPFDQRIPDTAVDPELADKLSAMLPGILNWALEGFARWFARGMTFDLPARVKDATAAYRRDQDTLGLWMAECAVTNLGAPGRDLFDTGAATLYASYVGWVGLNGSKALSRQSFAQRLQERGFTKRHTKKGSIYEGIYLRDEAQPLAEKFARDIEDRAVTRAR